MGEWDRLRRRASCEAECFDFLQPARLRRSRPRPCARSSTQRGLDDLRRLDPLTAAARAERGALRAPSTTRPASPGPTARSTTPWSRGPGRLPGLRPHHDRHLPRLGHAGALRLGLPVHRPRRDGDRSDPDATHAWVEVFLPSLRWVGFDPTNNMLAGERHVAVAIGRDYADVPPSRGVFKGDAESQLSVGVSVRRASSPPPSRSSCAWAPRPSPPPAAAPAAPALRSAAAAAAAGGPPSSTLRCERE